MWESRWCDCSVSTRRVQTSVRHRGDLDMSLLLLLLLLVLLVCGSGRAQSSSNATDNFEDSDVVFLVDGSGSVSSSDFRKVKSFIGSMMNRLSLGPNRTRVGLVQYSHHTSPSILLEQGVTRSVLDQKLREMRQLTGGTRTGAALQSVARDFFSHSSRSKVLVLITDGESQDNVGPASRELRRLGVKTYVIGFGSPRVSEMLTIASSPLHSFIVPSTDGLDTLINSLYTPDVQCKTTAKADIVLLVDGSDSIAPTNFQTMKDFFALMIGAFDIGPERVQIGLAQFSTDTRTEWHLNSHPTKASLLQALANVTQMDGLTNTGKALNFVFQNHFCPNVGLRDDAKKILVVITDGNSSDEIGVNPQNLRDSGIELFSIGVKGVDENELRSIASDPDDIHMYNDFPFLVDIVEQLMENLCNSVKGAGPTVTTGLVPARPFVSSGWVSQSSPLGPHSPPPDVGEEPVMVHRHLDFSVSCFVKPNLLDGRFLLVTPAGNHTLPAVNHSAHFLFPAFSPAHSGAYTCVYLLQVGCGNLTFQGPALRLKLGDVQCQTSAQADIVLLVDGSASGRIDLHIMRNFIALMGGVFDIGPERVQIGLAQFSSETRTEWHLNSHPTKASLLQALANLTYKGGDKNIGKALNFVFQNHFCPNVGLRDDAKKILVVITDGNSSDEIGVNPQNLRDSGIELFAIGVKGVDENELRSIASDPDDIHMYNDFPFLVDIVEQLMENLCNSVKGAGPTVTTGLVPARPFVSSGWVSQSSPLGPHSPPPDVGEEPVMVHRHLDFSVSCFVKPNLLDGRFLLVTPAGNHTLPAVNHSAHFLFPAFSPAHSGAYTCVYLLQVGCGNLTFQGPALRLKLEESNTKLLIGATVSSIFLLLLLLSTIILYYYCNYYGFYNLKLTTRGRTSNRSLRVQFRANKPPSSL